MNSAFADWQSWTALLVVAGTATIFLKRAFWRNKKTGGCASCGTGSARPVAGSRLPGR